MSKGGLSLSPKERKEDRRCSGLADTMSSSSYNTIIGGCLIYGFLMNAIIVNLFGDVVTGINPIVLLVGYFICCLLGVFLTMSNSPALSFLGYSLVVIPIGVVLALCLPSYDSGLIFQAIVITGCIVVVMTILATCNPNFFAGLGKTLFISLLVLIVVELIAVFLFGYTGTIFDYLVVALFSLYIGYDWHVAQSFPKTLDNAIDSACDLYLDIINIFIRVLSILGNRD